MGSRLSTETDNGVTTSYTYDAVNQLTGDGTRNYSYDLNGNRTGGSNHTGSANQLTTDGAWNFTYDNEGNLTKAVRISDGLTWTYSYDNENHLATVATPRGDTRVHCRSRRRTLERRQGVLSGAVVLAHRHELATGPDGRLPLRQRRQTHQVSLGVGVRAETKLGATVVDEVEFDVAAPLDQQSIARRLIVG